VESVQNVSINSLVRKAKEEFKLQFIKSHLELGGKQILIDTSKTRFGGSRLWFLCPVCNKRKGVLYIGNMKVGCRVCLNLKYRRQRYKGMIESNLQTAFH